MSCWVVATLAAEYLGIPVSQILEHIRTGALPSKTELGFLLVDVAPAGPRIDLKPHASTTAPKPRPSTYRSLAEVQQPNAPHTDPPRPQTHRPLDPEIPLPRSPRGGHLHFTPTPFTPETFTPDPELSAEEELALGVDPDPSPTPSKFEKSDWRQSRAASSRTRLRPPPRPA